MTFSSSLPSRKTKQAHVRKVYPFSDTPNIHCLSQPPAFRRHGIPDKIGPGSISRRGNSDSTSPKCPRRRNISLFSSGCLFSRVTDSVIRESTAPGVTKVIARVSVSVSRGGGMGTYINTTFCISALKAMKEKQNWEQILWEDAKEDWNGFRIP